MTDEQDSESKGQYRYARGFSSNQETFPSSEGQKHGGEFGFVEAADANDNEPSTETRTGPAKPRWEGRK